MMFLLDREGLCGITLQSRHKYGVVGDESVTGVKRGGLSFRYQLIDLQRHLSGLPGGEK